jgi:hypothetical protein
MIDTISHQVITILVTTAKSYNMSWVSMELNGQRHKKSHTAFEIIIYYITAHKQFFPISII